MLETRFFQVCEDATARWDVPALAVGVRLGGLTETFALGCAPETRFTCASITKPFVAHAVLELLELDEQTGIWPDDVRVRNLLSHTSGFDCELSVDQRAFGDGDDALARCVAELPAVRRFVGSGEIWSYANTGFWLAAHLAATRAGTTFEDAMAEHVLRPALLEATDFEPPDVEGTGPGSGVGPYPRARRPSGGLTSNVDDLLRFAHWHMAQPSSARLRVVAGKPLRGVYGLGLFGERVDGVDVWGHSGSYGGFQSSLLMLPDRDAAFVGLTNSGIGSNALRQIEDEFFTLAVGTPRRQLSFVELEPSRYSTFAGMYANAATTWHVTYDGGNALEVLVDGDTYRARAIDEQTFLVPEGPHMHERFDFPRDGLARFGSLAERVA